MSTAYSNELRELLDRDGILVCPGCHDPITARVGEALGFDAVYMTGYGTSMAVTGFPDVGLITMPEMIGNADTIQETVDVPVIADADNGYGNATNVIRTVREYAKTGVGAIHIEDQAFPKRCGGLSGKEFVSREGIVGKIRAAADVRAERDPDLVLIGRTGTPDIDEKIDRANEMVEAGADVIFPTGMSSAAEAQRLGEEIHAPLLTTAAAMRQPLVTDLDTLESWGYEVLIYPDVSMFVTMLGMESALERLQEEGPEGLEALREDLEGSRFEGLHEFAGVPEVFEWEKEYLPDA